MNSVDPWNYSLSGSNMTIRKENCENYYLVKKTLRQRAAEENHLLVHDRFRPAQEEPVSLQK